VGVAEGGIPVDLFHELAYIDKPDASWTGQIPSQPGWPGPRLRHSRVRPAMTTAGLDRPTPGDVSPAASGARRNHAAAGLRLARLYLASRRVPTALALLAGLGALLWAALHWHWNIAGGPAAQQFIPLTIQTGAAAVIAVTTYGPFGEPERAAGATSGRAPGGDLALLRNLGGMVGIGLLSAAIPGGAFGWVGPMAFLLITEGALAHRSATPWVWPARPPDDRGGAICACLVLPSGWR